MLNLYSIGTAIFLIVVIALIYWMFKDSTEYTVSPSAPDEYLKSGSPTPSPSEENLEG